MQAPQIKEEFFQTLHREREKPFMLLRQRILASTARQRVELLYTNVPRNKNLEYYNKEWKVSSSATEKGRILASTAVKKGKVLRCTTEKRNFSSTAQKKVNSFEQH